MMVLIGIFSLIGALAISFANGWKLALVALCVTIPLGVLSGYFRVKYEIDFNAMNEAVFQESSKFGAESIGAFRTVCALVMEDSIVSRYEQLLNGHVRAAFRKARWTTIIFALSDSVTLGCQALIFWYGGRLLLSGEYEVTAFLITYMAVIQGAESAGQYFSMGPNAAQASAAANRILGARESRNRDAVPATEQVPDTDGGVKIELRNVHFKYPTREVSIFRGLNITIEKGQFAALVGASGSGKTSIVSLLERFYDVSQGSILFNDRDISEINIYEYRKLLSLVAQEPSLFQGMQKPPSTTCTPSAPAIKNERVANPNRRHAQGEHPPRRRPLDDHRRAAPPVLPGRQHPRLHRLPPGRLRHAHRQPRRQPQRRPEAARLHRAGPDPQSPRLAAGRGHELARLR